MPLMSIPSVMIFTPLLLLKTPRTLAGNFGYVNRIPRYTDLCQPSHPAVFRISLRLGTHSLEDRRPAQSAHRVSASPHDRPKRNMRTGRAGMDGEDRQRRGSRIDSDRLTLLSALFRC